MKKSALVVVFVSIVSVFSTSTVFARNPLLDALVQASGVIKYSDFENFHAAFSKAVLSGNRRAIKTMISTDFQWAEDEGFLRRDEVVRRMDRDQYWRELKTAMKEKAMPFVDSECDEGQCLEVTVMSHYKSPLMFVFKRDPRGVWFWQGLR